MQRKRLLVVEDDGDIAHLVEFHLLDLGCEVVLAFDGQSGLEQALAESFDLMILDLMLPRLSGLELCRRVRAAADYTPILMLTAKSSEAERVKGLELGADDYLVKPFSLRELLARVKALLRRVDVLGSRPLETGGLVCRGDLWIDPEKRKVVLQGREVTLTAKEFDLLWQFVSYPGRVYTRSQLLDLVWGYGYEGFEHTVNSHINRLRAKIETNPAAPTHILTVWGIGYKFAEQA